MYNEISDFKSVWESRKNNNPELSTETRENLYSKINKISSSRDGSLLDRFSDRFGSELDREIIVLRKKEQQDLRSIKPKVELISIPDQSNEMTFSEFKESMEDEEFISKVADATGISEEAISGMDLDELKVFFDKADTDNSGSIDFDEFVLCSERTVEPKIKTFNDHDWFLGIESSSKIKSSSRKLSSTSISKSASASVSASA